MANISVYLSQGYAAPVAFENVIIIADKPSSFEVLTVEHPVSVAAGFSEPDLALIHLAATTKLSPSQDNGASVEVYVQLNGSLRRVSLCCLSTAHSRHNAPSRPHTVSALVKANRGSGSVQVFLLPAHRDYAYAQACAVARQFPTFSLKSKGSDSSKKTPDEVHIVVHLADGTASDGELVKDIEASAEYIRLAQRLVDTPPNLLNTTAYVQESREVAEHLGCQIEVIQGAELEARGFGGLWGVGKASEHLPALVILSHIPEGTKDSQSICLVGKGIVYDTGGLSIKTPGTNMAGMKTDMGGSAAVLGAFAVAVRRQVNKRIHALLCISENSVGPLSTRPDDVHTFLSGKTVEVNNTDAEGRLVLADGCYYASAQLNPAVIVDIATLTGAQLIATGKNHAAVYSNAEDLEAAVVQAGKVTGDLTFPIPYCPEFYRAEFKSVVADMKNSVADRGNAQASCAAQFIGNHIEEYITRGGKWAHVDMAGPVSAGGRATGYGVALLYGLVRDFPL